MTTEEKCMHHWMIDSADVGVCKNCGSKINFKKQLKELLRLEPKPRPRFVLSKMDKTKGKKSGR